LPGHKEGGGGLAIKEKITFFGTFGTEEKKGLTAIKLGGGGIRP